MPGMGTVAGTLGESDGLGRPGMTQGVSRRNPPLVGRFPGGNLAAVTSEGGKLGQGEAAPWPGDRAPTMGPGHWGAGGVMGDQTAP